MLLTWAIPVAQRHRRVSDWSAMMNSLGMVFTYQARYDEALKLHFENLRKREEDEARYGNLSTSLVNIGLVYYKMREFDRSLSYYTRALDIKRRKSDDHDLDLTLLNIASCYAYKEQYDSARKYATEAIKECGEICSKMRVRDVEIILGLVNIGQKQFAAAEKHFLRSYAISKEINDPRFQLDNIGRLAEIYLLLRQFDKAASFLREAERVIQTGTTLKREVATIYKRYAQMYSHIGDYREAWHYQEKYISLNDSIYDEEVVNNLMKIEADYLERENKARLAAQEEVLALNTKIIHNQKLTNLISIALVVVVIAFAMVLLRQYVRKKRDNTRLDLRVRERTHELEINRETLLKALEERDFVLSQINAEVRDALSRFRGLTALCTAEIADPLASQYFGEFTKTAEDLSVNVGHYFSREKSERILQ